MKTVIDSYIYAVTKQLNDVDAEGVAEELEAHIQDMLSDTPTKEEVIAVLESLGDPKDLASQYRSKDRYLISPRIFETYLSVLIQATVAIMAVTAVFTIIGLLFSEDTNALTLGNIIGSTIRNSIQNGVSSLVYITIGFVIYEQTQLHRKEKWNISMLPKQPRKGTKRLRISVAEVIVETVVTVFGSCCFILLAFDRSDVLVRGTTINLGEYLNLPYLESFIPAIVILSITLIVLQIYKIYKAHWDMSMAIMNLVIGVITSVIIVIICTSNSLFLVDFNELVYSYTSWGLSITPLEAFRIFIIAAAMIGVVFDDAVPLYKLTLQSITNKKHTSS